MIRILIADDHPIVREGLKRIVADCQDIEVVAETGDGNAAIELVRDEAIDVVLLDISMPGPGFLEVLRQVRLADAETRVLVLSVQPENHYAVRAINAGAAGYLTKDHSPENLADAVRQVYLGGRYVTPGLAERLLQDLTNSEFC